MRRTMRPNWRKEPALELAQSVPLDIRPREHEQYARGAEGRGPVDSADPRMGMGRAQNIAIGRVRNMDIVDELTATREET
jgi:hypothetical protein